MKWTRSELLAAKRRHQATVERLGGLERDLTDTEREALRLALRAIREIAKTLAAYRPVTPKKSRA